MGATTALRNFWIIPKDISIVASLHLARHAGGGGARDGAGDDGACHQRWLY